MSEEDEKQPDGVKHYESLDDFPQERRDDLKKFENSIPRGDLCLNTFNRYWYRRHELFSKYDEGIWMTESAWYGVTQEAVAT